MKIQIDYDTKTVTLDNNVNLGEFMVKIKVILPDWKDWKLNTNTNIVYPSSPILIERPYRPWWQGPLVTYSGTSTGTFLTSQPSTGKYMLEVND